MLLTNCEQYITVSEACYHLTCSKWLIYELIKDGSIDAIRLRRNWKINKESFEKYLNGCKIRTK